MQKESRNRLSFSFGLSRAFVREAGQRGHSVIIAAVSAESEIKRRIAQRGPITFAEFMEVALYWPDGGYYSRGDPIGGEGDFFTSPLAHPAFGALLAVQLFQMWEIMGRPCPFTVIEPGAGNGLLCRDVLAFADGFPQNFAQSLRYVCVERRGRPGEEAGHPRAHRITADHLPFRRIEGCVLSNEFLDALPVHQVVVEERQLREVFVTLDDGGLVTVTGSPSTPALAERLDAVGVTLAEGQTAELNLDLNAWAADVAGCLSQGFVLTVDYGRPAAELYSFEARPRGTLTTFYRHLQTDSPLGPGRPTGHHRPSGLHLGGPVRQTGGLGLHRGCTAGDVPATVGVAKHARGAPGSNRVADRVRSQPPRNAGVGQARRVGGFSGLATGEERGASRTLGAERFSGGGGDRRKVVPTSPHPRPPESTSGDVADVTGPRGPRSGAAPR